MTHVAMQNEPGGALVWAPLVLFPVSLLFCAPLLLLVTLSAAESAMGFGLFDPATGQDPMFGSWFGLVRVPAALGIILGAFSVILLVASRTRSRGTAFMALSHGVVLALPGAIGLLLGRGGNSTFYALYTSALVPAWGDATPIIVTTAIIGCASVIAGVFVLVARTRR